MPTERASGRQPPSGLVVLVVEDEALIALHLEFILKRHGWRVLGPAASVARALRLLDEGERPDVALLDLNLCGELVIPVAEALRARGVPFVLASAYVQVELVAPVLIGMPNVGKPTDERCLLAVLAQAVER